jgi:hypothetical protein
MIVIKTKVNDNPKVRGDASDVKGDEVKGDIAELKEESHTTRIVFVLLCFVGLLVAYPNRDELAVRGGCAQGHKYKRPKNRGKVICFLGEFALRARAIALDPTFSCRSGDPPTTACLSDAPSLSISSCCAVRTIKGSQVIYNRVAIDDMDGLHSQLMDEDNNDDDDQDVVFERPHGPKHAD